MAAAPITTSVGYINSYQTRIRRAIATSRPKNRCARWHQRCCNNYTDKSQFGRFVNVRASRSDGEIGNSFYRTANHLAEFSLQKPFKITIGEQIMVSSWVSSMFWRKSYQVYTILQLKASETRKLEIELFPAADSLAMTAPCLIVRDRITGIKFLVDRCLYHSCFKMRSYLH